MTCRVAGCDHPAVCKGFCNPHYMRWWRHGDPLKGGVRRRGTALERLWQRVEKGEGCWIWPDATNDAGYGQVHHQGRVVYVHRLAYEQLVGPIPEGLVLDHLCRNTRCVNPAHLEPVTIGENVRRGFEGRTTVTVRPVG